MKRLLPCLLLLAPALAMAQPSLGGFLGFRSLYYLLNRSEWPTLPRECADVRSGPAVVGLADPLQAVVVFNAWHVPGAAGGEDIRLADLRKHVLRSDVVFRAGWPGYAVPGFIVLVQKRDREWALVARLDDGYLVEDRSGIGICSLSGP